MKCHKAVEVTRDRNIKAKEAELEADNGTNEPSINGEIAALRTKTEGLHLTDANQGHVIVTEAIDTLMTALVTSKILQCVKCCLRHWT